MALDLIDRKLTEPKEISGDGVHMEIMLKLAGQSTYVAQCQIQRSFLKRRGKNI
jgi:hypothetical protein